MHTLAEILFWAGRLQTVVGLLLLLHSLVIWHWRHDPFKCRLSSGWLGLFMLGSAFCLLDPGPLWRALHGMGYVTAHLYGGLWTDEVFLEAMLARWQFIWLPIYVPWISIWCAGIGVIALMRPSWLTRGSA